MNEVINERERLCELYGEDVVNAAEALAGAGYSFPDIMEAARIIVNVISGAFESLKKTFEQLAEFIKDLDSPAKQSKLERIWTAQRRRVDREKIWLKVKAYNERASALSARRRYVPP